MRVGPLELVEVVGRGGMGVVWKARHIHDDVDVALKLVRFGSPVERTALRREIRAVAGLSHPHIVAVYDYGDVPLTAPAGAEGVRPGAPYVVMELLEGGGLLERSHDLGWLGTRAMLLTVLDALAHAHARGVVHRDLKPANVLCDREGTWRLVDFGIANTIDRPGRAWGTPGYMAPEVLRGASEDVGPWTDLFAVGCLAWYALCGGPPVPGASRESLLRLHKRQWPALEPRIGVPTGLEAWLHRLLEPNTGLRFRRAADAAWALRGLGPAVGAGTPHGASAAPAATTFSLDLPEMSWRPEHTDEGPEVAVGRPPCPRTWSTPPRSAPAPSHLGLGLLGLRAHPLVGRVAERDALWAELVQLHTARGARAIELIGPDGVGRTALASWLCARAHELGLATVVPIDGSRGGALRQAALDLLRLPIDPSRAARRLARRFESRPDSWYVRAWLAWLGLADDTTPDRDEQVALVSSLLRRMAESRPVVLCVDNAGKHRHPLHLVERVLLECGPGAAPAQAPILALLIRDGELRADGVVPMEVGWLRRPELWGLVREVLQLEPDLARQVVDRSAGDPRYAIQLVHGWAQEGLLEPGPRGYALDDPDAALPQSVDAVLTARLEAWLGQDTEAAELAATLGRAVDDAEWRRACAAAGIEPEEGWIERGLREGLLQRRAVGISFAEPRARALLLERCTDPARWHRACAEALHDAGPERRAPHLLGSGRHAEAADALFAAARAAIAAGAYPTAISQLERAEELFGRERGAERAEAVGWRTWALYQLGRFEEAAGVARVLASEARMHGWSAPLGSALHTLGVVAFAQGGADAVALLQDAAEAYRAGGNAHSAAHAEMTALELSTPDDAPERLRAMADAATDVGLRAAALLHLAGTELRRDALDAARAAAEEARQGFASQGNIAAEGACLLTLGEILARMGALAASERALREILERELDDLGARALAAEVTLAVVLLLRGAWLEAGPRLRRSLRLLARSEWRLTEGTARYALAALCAHDGRGDAFDEALRRAESLREQVEHPVVFARALLGLARDAWLQHRDGSRVDAVDAVLRSGGPVLR